MANLPILVFSGKCQTSCTVLGCKHNPHLWTSGPRTTLMKSVHETSYSLLAGLPACAIKPLQLIQNAAARLVFNLPKFSHVTPSSALSTGFQLKLASATRPWCLPTEL